MIGLVWAHIQRNSIPNLELQQLYKASRDYRVLPSTTIRSNICRRDYKLTMDAIKKGLPLGNKVSSALDGWKSTNKIAIICLFAYYIDRNGALHEVQLAFIQVGHQFCSAFES